MAQTFRSRRELLDNRSFNLGEIWKVRDELIRLLPSDRIAGERTLYRSRTVVIVQNCPENHDENYLNIRIAPLSTTLDFKQKFDVELFPDEPEIKKDGVNGKCMAQIQLTQPILKKDLFECVGVISDEKKTEIAATIMKMIGIDLDSL